MHPVIKLAAVISVLCLAAWPKEVVAVPLVGCSFGSDGQTWLYDVDPWTGQATHPRPTGLDHVIGIAPASNSALYALTNGVALTDLASLFRVNVATGASQLVGSTGLTGIVEGDLAVDPTDGRLYGLYVVSGSARRLFTMDPDTGTAELLTDSLTGDPSAMAFDARGTLYAIDTSLQRLFQVDKDSGFVMSSLNLSVTLGSAAGMIMDRATGTFYVADGEDGSTNKLYTMNVHTGQLTSVGPTGLTRGLSGLTIVPEPGAALLPMLGSAVSLLYRRA